MALSCWGLWAFLPKLAVNYMNPKSAFMYEVLGGVLVGVVVLLTMDVQLEYDLRGIIPSVFTGVAGYLGLFFFLYALQLGKVSVTSTFTAVYPMVTLLLAMVFLKERINPVQWLGVALAFVSVYLISWE